MKREIKFRAYGYNPMVKKKVMMGGFTLEELYKNLPKADFSKMIWMQYTGLKDKNGKEIYEGDIVGDFSEKRLPKHLVVVWDKDKNPHLLCGQCQRGKKVDSTPSEGWDLESLIAQEIGYISGIFMSQGDTKAKDIIMPTEELKEVADRINLYCLKEIAKARQEVMMTELVHCEVIGNIYENKELIK
jgi:uncharacterized phage protein (TIGR01671 family)